MGNRNTKLISAGMPDRKLAHEMVLQFVNDIYCPKDR